MLAKISCTLAKEIGLALISSFIFYYIFEIYSKKKKFLHFFVLINNDIRYIDTEICEFKRINKLPTEITIPCFCNNKRVPNTSIYTIIESSRTSTEDLAGVGNLVDEVEKIIDRVIGLYDLPFLSENTLFYLTQLLNDIRVFKKWSTTDQKSISYVTNFLEDLFLNNNALQENFGKDCRKRSLFFCYMSSFDNEYHKNYREQHK